jgi:hypothetical protein
MNLGFFMQGVLGIMLGVFYKDLLSIFPLSLLSSTEPFVAFGEFGPR